MKKRIKLAVVVVVLLLIPTGYWFVTTQINQPEVAQTQVYTNIEFTFPTGIYFPDDDSNSVYVTELQGTVLRFDNDQRTSKSVKVLDLSSEIGKLEDEEGLVSLAFDPEFEENRHFYVHYTSHTPLQTIVSRFTLNASGIAPISSELILFNISQPYRNHNGGGLMFGEDKLLYIGFGDGGLYYDPLGHGQNTSSIFSTVVRINPSQSSVDKNYTIPSDNPFVGDPDGIDEIYSYGLRNPYKMSQDPVTKKIWVGDVGQDDREEIDILRSGHNYGWSIYEGTLCLQEENCDVEYTKPYYEYTHDEGHAVIGGYVYRGSDIENLQGKYVFADWLAGEMYWIPSDEDKVQRKLLLEISYLVSSFGQDLDNEIYACAFDGRIFRIDNA